jgi:cupin fold WbuC family metalloprotein
MTKIIQSTDLAQLAGKAAGSERRRAHLNMHDTLEAPVQRLFIAVEPDSYMRPHRHPQSNKWEMFVLLNGEIDLLVFADDGTLKQRETLSANALRAVEIPPNTWHAYVCRQPGTVVLEVKEGPYIPTPAEDFAPWSPAEGEEGAPSYLNWMRNAQRGEKY